MNIKTINIVNSISEILFNKKLLYQISVYNKGSDIIFILDSTTIKIFSGNSLYILNDMTNLRSWNCLTEKRIDKFYKLLKQRL